MSGRGIGAQLLDMLFPPRCQACGTLSADPVCETCHERILFIDPPLCPGCGTILPDRTPECLPGAMCRDCRDGRYLSGARSVGLHAGPLRDAIIAYKFRGRRRLAPWFARMLTEVVEAECGDGHCSGLPLTLCAALIPVPLHPRRRRWRGFDQAELLAEELGGLLGLPVWTDALERIRETRPQTELAARSRRRNVRGAFEARKRWRLRDRSVVLIDDVFTTGATLDECALTIKRAGAAAVYALTVSRAEPTWHRVSVAGADLSPQGDEADD